MGFWIFMTAMCLLVPLIMVSIGGVFREKSPGEINPVYGYRTTMSMKNQDTWDFANKCFGRLAWKWGWWMAAVSFLSMLPFLRADKEAVSIAGLILMCLQLIPVLGTIPVVERALKRNFNKDGTRRT